jgi:hypothetical protein
MIECKLRCSTSESPTCSRRHGQVYGAPLAKANCSCATTQPHTVCYPKGKTSASDFVQRFGQQDGPHPPPPPTTARIAPVQRQPAAGACLRATMHSATMTAPYTAAGCTAPGSHLWACKAPTGPGGRAVAAGQWQQGCDQIPAAGPLPKDSRVRGVG